MLLISKYSLSTSKSSFTFLFKKGSHWKDFNKVWFSQYSFENGFKL